MDKSFTLVLAGLALGSAGLWLTRPQRLLAFEFARQRRRAGARVARAALPDGEVSYLYSGTADAASGTPILHVHGFTGMKENWLPLMAAMGPGFRQYAPDLPGWGESERRDGADPGYAAQAERLAGFIDTVIGAPVTLVGHSMGGGIAAVLAARHPDKVRRLVLMSAAGVRFEDNAFGQAVLDGGNPFGVTDEAELRRYLALVFERPPWVPRTVARWMVRRRIADAQFEQRGDAPFGDDTAGGGAGGAGDDLEQGALARTVGAQDGKRFAGGDVKVHVTQHPALLVAHAQTQPFGQATGLAAVALVGFAHAGNV